MDTTHLQNGFLKECKGDQLHAIVFVAINQEVGIRSTGNRPWRQSGMATTLPIHSNQMLASFMVLEEGSLVPPLTGLDIDGNLENLEFSMFQFKILDRIEL